MCSGLRPVLIIALTWPDGTMSMKFGAALMAALGLRQGQGQLLQLAPERIFRVETGVTEAEFRDAMEKKDVSCAGPILFIELGT